MKTNLSLSLAATLALVAGAFAPSPAAAQVRIHGSALSRAAYHLIGGQCHDDEDDEDYEDGDWDDEDYEDYLEDLEDDYEDYLEDLEDAREDYEEDLEDAYEDDSSFFVPSRHVPTRPGRPGANHQRTRLPEWLVGTWRVVPAERLVGAPIVEYDITADGSITKVTLANNPGARPKVSQPQTVSLSRGRLVIGQNVFQVQSTGSRLILTGTNLSLTLKRVP